MAIAQYKNLSWKDIKASVEHDCRLIFPLGATEAHSELSVCTDTLIAEEIALVASEATGVLVAPSLPFGCSAFALNYPGTLTLRTSTMLGIIEDLIQSSYTQGFRRMIFITGHGGNEVITGLLSEMMAKLPRSCIYYWNVWQAVSAVSITWANELGYPPNGHASWIENHEITRVKPVLAQKMTPVEHPDFPPFPINPRLAPHYLPDAMESGCTTAPEKACNDILRIGKETFVDFIKNIPPEIPAV
ncbi:MAG: creatininase family protein [Desulfarculaceae bacterium]|nr:creatininase family protein [Desulfarculaceae bacterium]